jgi:transcriptional regulator with GAF, ATPase, and Fis domain
MQHVDQHSLFTSSANDTLSYRALALKELAQTVIAEVETLGSLRELDLSRGIDMHAEVRNYEIALIQRALKLTGGSQRRAAKLLGLLPTTLNNKIKRYQIEW